MFRWCAVSTQSTGAGLHFIAEFYYCPWSWNRYAGALLGLLLQRGDPALDRDRPPSERVVGCCRDAAVVFLALARAKGLPARARVGFAAYLVPGWLIDHVVAEVRDETEGRWRVVDPGMDASWAPSFTTWPR